MSVAVQLNGKEQQQYSIARAILSAADKTNSFEAEVGQEIQRQLGRGAGHGGVFIPTVMTRAGLDTKSSSKGSELVFKEAGPFIQALRLRSVLLRLGATLLPGLKQDVDLPAFTAGAQANWVAENSTAVTLTDPATAKVSLVHKTLTSLVSFSRVLLATSTPEIDLVLVDSIAEANAAALDHAGFYGNGTTQPNGIFNQALAGNTIAFGGAITFAKCCDMETAIGEAHGETGEMAFVATPKVRRAARQAAKSATLTSSPIWGDDNLVAGHRAEATKSVETDAAGQALALGVWSEVVIGEFGAIEMVFDPYTQKKQGMIELETYYFCDLNFRHLESFAVSSGLTAS